MKTNITIKKAKIKDNHFLEVEYTEDLKEGTDTVKKTCSAAVHDDLKAAYQRLDVHLSKLCEQYSKLGQLDTPNIHARGFTIGGSGESEGVTISGWRALETGNRININTPFTRWDDPDYGYISELGEAIEACKGEVMLYLFEGKHQPDAQMEIAFEDVEDQELR